MEGREAEWIEGGKGNRMDEGGGEGEGEGSRMNGWRGREVG